MHILNAVLGDARGGRWQVVCDYTRLLAAHGHRVTLLLSGSGAGDTPSFPDGVGILRIRNHGHYDFPAAWRLRRRLSGAPPALGLAHCSRSVALLKHALPRTPVLAVSHSTKVRRLLKADACLALNRAIRRDFEAAGSGKPCHVLPNMIALDGARPPGDWVPQRPVRVGALGRFDPVKGFDTFVEALVALQAGGVAFRAVLGGCGSAQAALQAQVAQAGLGAHVAFPGWIADVDRFLAGLDILCVPARADAFGLTPLQGARAGVPMLLSAVSGHLEMFQPERHALCFEAGDARALAAGIVRLCEQPALATALRSAAFQQVATHCSEPIVAKRLIELIESTII